MRLITLEVTIDVELSSKEVEALANHLCDVLEDEREDIIDVTYEIKEDV